MWKIFLPVLAAVFSVGLGALVGGPQQISNDDEGARNALNFALADYNRNNNNTPFTTLSMVKKVERQVVSGYLYTITAEIGKPPCGNSDANEQCAGQEDPAAAQVITCTFKVWDRPWLSLIEMKDFKCGS
uniref:cystatin C (amyloid angiopathy and cerebral hemorrhage) n=1 Tax=Semicossyphus pulcher TaxID=241346 RepID=UPI0037E85642